jgi:hypothetical protein
VNRGASPEDPPVGCLVIGLRPASAHGVVADGDRVYLFDSPFDDETGGYANHYTIYRLPEDAGARLDDASWDGLSELGRIPVGDRV